MLSSRAAGAALALLAVGCRDATQVRVDLSTDLVCGTELESTGLSVAAPGRLEAAEFSTETSKCTAGEIGWIVLTPREDDDAAFALRVVGGVGVSASECAQTGFDTSKLPVGAGCVVARRSLGFLPHEGLRLPVRLDRSCINVACDEEQTCFRGDCVAATLDPHTCLDADGCTPSGGEGGAGGGAPLSPGFTPLGRPFGASGSHALGVSADGRVVVGYVDASPTQTQAVVWGVSAEATSLPSLGGPADASSTAVAANRDGTVVVGAAGDVPARWRGPSASAISAEPLAVLFDEVGAATACDGSGERVAGYTVSNLGSDGKLWDATGAQVLSIAQSVAFGIDSQGRTLVGHGTNTGSENAFELTVPEDGMPVFLEQPPPYSGSSASAVDGSGRMIGYLRSDTGMTKAVRWGSPTAPAVLLADLAGYFGASALATSEDGSVVVGEVDDPDPNFANRAVLWSGGGSAVLVADALAAAGIEVPAGWALTFARSVSADGKVVVGEGRAPDGHDEAWRAVFP